MKRAPAPICPTIRSSRPTESVLPRPHRDAGERMKHYGPIEPMQYDEPGMFARLFRRFF
jgi:hypothetical protein